MRAGIHLAIDLSVASSEDCVLQATYRIHYLRQPGRNIGESIGRFFDVRQLQAPINGCQPIVDGFQQQDDVVRVGLRQS